MYSYETYQRTQSQTRKIQNFQLYMYQIHAVPCAANQTNIADGIQSAKLVKLQTFMHKMDGHKFDSPKPPIDPSDKFVDSSTQVLVLFDILSGRDGELNEDHL